MMGQTGHAGARRGTRALRTRVPPLNATSYCLGCRARRSKSTEQEPEPYPKGNAQGEVAAHWAAKLEGQGHSVGRVLRVPTLWKAGTTSSFQPRPYDTAQTQITRVQDSEAGLEGHGGMPLPIHVVRPALVPEASAVKLSRPMPKAAKHSTTPRTQASSS
eukprot:1143089-Pelagomonas_calceolata.AAC.9